jgi:uncharacterized damage-inducible protein DinB
MTIDPANTSPVALLYPELDHEMTVTRSLLSIVPWEHADWKPHPKSMSLRSLAGHVAQLPSFLTTMIAMDVLHFNPADFKTPPLTGTDDLLALFDSELAKMRSALASLDWAQLGGSWKMMMGEHTIVDGQRAFLLRHMGINHIVHHRAQLGVFLRLLNVPIPGSYGPSADTMG